MAPKVELGSHPRGEKGAWRSVWKTAEKAKRGRLNVYVRKWAIDAIKAAGAPTGTADRAKAIFDALVASKIYVPDPVDAELIPEAECVIANCGGLELGGGDCDDLVVSLVSAWESVGIRAAVVAHRYDDRSLEHVLAVCWDGRQWHYADPSARMEFGVSRAPTQEVWVSVPELELLCDRAGRCETSPPALAPRENGDYVGVGTPPVAVGVGQPPAAPGGNMETQLVPVTGSELAGQQAAFAAVFDKLQLARKGLVYSYALMRATRDAIGRPAVDPYVFAGAQSDAWTQEHENRLRGLDRIATVTASYSREAADGRRRIEMDQATGRVGPVAYSYEPAVYLEPDGEIVLTSGASEQPAAVVPAGFVSGPPVVGAGVVIIVVAVALAGAVAVYSAATVARDYIERRRRKDLQEHQQELLRRFTPAEVETMMRNLGETAQRQAAAQTEAAKADPLSDLASTAKVVGTTALGLGAVVAVLYGFSALSARRRYGYAMPMPMYG